MHLSRLDFRHFQGRCGDSGYHPRFTQAVGGWWEGAIRVHRSPRDQGNSPPASLTRIYSGSRKMAQVETSDDHASRAPALVVAGDGVGDDSD